MKFRRICTEILIARVFTLVIFCHCFFTPLAANARISHSSSAFSLSFIQPKFRLSHQSLQKEMKLHHSFTSPLLQEKKHHVLYSFSPETNDGEDKGSFRDITKKPKWEQGDYVLLSILSSMGIIETGFLTYTKLYGSLEALCSTANKSGNPLSLTCGDVLTSHWASIMGIPLPAIGLGAYSLILLISVNKALKMENIRNTVSSISESNTSPESQKIPILLIGTSIMAVFSSYLMGLLIFDLKTACPYCIASASLTYAMAYLSWKKEWNIDRLSTLVFGATSVVVGILLSGLIFFYGSLEEINRFLDGSSSVKDFYPNSTTNRVTSDNNKSSKKVLYLAPDITTTSTEQALRVGEKLKSLNSRMFGAYWCSHCYEQKQEFGKEAYEKYIEYIECAPDGADNQISFCKESKIPGYPTWQINGKLYPGQKTLDELEQILKDL